MQNLLFSTFSRGGRASDQGLKPQLRADPSLLVNSLYKSAFGRLGDAEGVANWVRQLRCEASLEAVAEALVSSTEFHARHGLNQIVDIDYLKALYRDGLARGPDPEGLAHWLAAGEKGATRAKVLAEFAGSEEALRGVAVLFVTSIYKVAFGRPVDEGGLAKCVRQLLSGVSLEALAEELVASLEFQARHGSSQKVDAEFLKALYRDGLEREPEKESLAHWVAEGNKGATRAMMLVTFAGCYEALQRVLERASANLPQIGPTNKFLRFAPPGHFYSPIPNEDTLECSELFSPLRPVVGIDLRENAQLKLLEELRPMFSRFPYGQNSVESADLFRFTLDNTFISAADAATLFAFLLRFNPSSIIEVGSGHSSALMLDAVERFLERRPQMLFIEPYPERLKSLLREVDRKSIDIMETPVESVPLKVFERLGPSDILFIDSSHVGKLGSDVLFLLFQVIPRLREGVIVHFHDIFWPFEYPKEWYLEGRCWNEAYLVRALLLFSTSLTIEFWPSYLAFSQPARLREASWAYRDGAGCSLWVRRTPRPLC